MKFYAALCGAAVLLSGVGAAQAGVETVQSKLTFTLTMQVTTDTGSADNDTKIQKIRFNTKDFLDLVDTATAQDAVMAVQVRNTAIANTIPAEADFLADDVDFLDADGTVIDDAAGADESAFIQTALDLTTLTGDTQLTQGTNTAGAVTDNGTIVTKRKDVISEGANWVIDANGDAAEATDQIEIDLLSTTTATSKSLTDPDDDTDAGLAMSSRVAQVFGGMHIDSGVFGATANLNGFMTGTVKAGAEKLQ